MSKDVFVVIEQRSGKVQKVSLELLCEAKRLAGELSQNVTAVFMGNNIADDAASLFPYGADKVIVIEDKLLETYVTEPYAKALTSVIKEYDPEIMLFGATSIGRDLAPRVAARVHTGLTADCTSLAIDPEEKLLRMTRPAFGGNIMATILCRTYRPQMATVRPGVIKLEGMDNSRKGEIINHHVSLSGQDMNVEILEIIPLNKKCADITAAKVIISGGRGVGGPEGFGPLHELAGAIGAEVGSSRICVDNGWIEKERQVGQTGKTVHPEVYMACGISGAIQHMAGMENSDFIIAINRDADAPMMKLADLAIVGDLKAIIPKLTQAVCRYKEGLPAQADETDTDSLAIYREKDNIAILTVNRPKALNALSEAVFADMEKALDKVDIEKTRCLVVTGAGEKAFVAGADIAAMRPMTKEEGANWSRRASAVFRRIEKLPIPVIAAVNGYALGGGCELAAACDIRIASENAVFGQPEVGLGILPGFGGTQRLPRLVSPGIAKEMIYSSIKIDAYRAKEIGLVNHVYPKEQLMEEAEKLASMIAGQGPIGVRAAKTSINEGLEVTIDEGLEIESALFGSCFDTADQENAMGAFLEKRKPDPFVNR